MRPSNFDDLPFRRLQQHLDRQPVGFPPGPDGSDIRLLKHIFTPREAEIATCLSHRPRPLEEIFTRAGHLVSSARELETHLTSMVKKGGLEFYREQGQARYANTPLVVGFYELQVNRLTPEFIRDFKAYSSGKRFGISFLSTGRSQMRTVPVNKTIVPQPAPAYHRIDALLASAPGPFVVLPCICRKKKQLQGEPCRRTGRTETCMAMGRVAQTLIEMEIGRELPRADAMEIIRQNQDEGLVLQPSNTQTIEFLCACCGCCCSMLGLQRDLPRPLDFWESGFLAVLDGAQCIGCGKCRGTCSTDALFLPPAGAMKTRPRPAMDTTRCIGCGHCAAACPTGALTLVPRPGQASPPMDREELNRILLKKKRPLHQVKTVAKLAAGMIARKDLRLVGQPGSGKS